MGTDQTKPDVGLTGLHRSRCQRFDAIAVDSADPGQVERQKTRRPQEFAGDGASHRRRAVSDKRTVDLNDAHARRRSLDLYRERAELSSRFVTSIQFKPPAAGSQKFDIPVGESQVCTAPKGPTSPSPI